MERFIINITLLLNMSHTAYSVDQEYNLASLASAAFDFFENAIALTRADGLPRDNPCGRADLKSNFVRLAATYAKLGEAIYRHQWIVDRVHDPLQEYNLQYLIGVTFALETVKTLSYGKRQIPHPPLEFMMDMVDDRGVPYPKLMDEIVNLTHAGEFGTILQTMRYVRTLPFRS